MTGVETIARIRFEHFQNGKGINLCGDMRHAWATRGRHFGWVVLSLVVGLAATGL